ncbi:hypothetical protein [Mucilaginibacter sp.]|uniref:hypothetical protein n=1 Tax=Mucilaginibacter sp. TaxID=1882438 RepID=UPI002852922D|nr:hypothetical protein [Mucilaginibacter sp.]
MLVYNSNYTSINFTETNLIDKGTGAFNRLAKRAKFSVNRGKVAVKVKAVKLVTG